MGKQVARAAVKAPKTKCCVSKKRCGSCPIRMLKEGTLPEGYGVRKRVLIKVDPEAADIVRPGSKDKAAKKAKKKAKREKQAAKAARRAAGLDRAA